MTNKIYKLLMFVKYCFIFVKCGLGFGTIDNEEICWFSKTFFDVHDYPRSKGGDGIPTSFHSYTCSKCGKVFTI